MFISLVRALVLKFEKNSQKLKILTSEKFLN